MNRAPDPISQLRSLDLFEQEYVDAKRGDYDDDHIADDIRQYRAIKASNALAAQQDAIGSEAPPVSASAIPEVARAPEDPPAPAPPNRREPRNAPTLKEFLAEVAPRNPDAPENELIAYWSQRYARPEHPGSLPTLEKFLEETLPRNPHSKGALTDYWNARYGSIGASEKNLGAMGTLAEGAKSTLRSLKSFGNTLVDNESGVVESANESSSARRDPALQQLLNDIDRRKRSLGDDPSWLSALSEVGKAAMANPKGAGLLALEQAPNSIAALGSMAAGAAAGSAIGPMGTIAGGIAGLFTANVALETGAKSIEKASDQSFTPEEQAQALREGAIKGAVVTGIDAATFGVTKFLTGTTARAMERATQKVLTDNGVDLADHAAVMAARQSPELTAKVVQAQVSAKDAVNTLTKRVLRGSGEVGLEVVSEGAGDYIGEYAATGKADKVEAVIEAFTSLGQSAGEIAAAHGLSRTPPTALPAPSSPPDRDEKQGPQQPQALGPQQPRPIGPNRPEPHGPVAPQALGPQQPQPFGPDLSASLGPELQRTLGPSNERPGPYRPTVKDILDAGSLDEAIETAGGLLNAAQVPFLPPIEKRAGTEIPIFPSADPSTEPLIQPGQVFIPRTEPTLSPREAIAAERARLLAMKAARQNVTEASDIQQANEMPHQATHDERLPSALEKSFPTAQEVKRQGIASGVSAGVLDAMARQLTGKSLVGDLSPAELQQLSTKLDAMKPASVHQPRPATSPDLFQAEPATGPLPVPQAAKIPRSDLAPAQNAGLLDAALRADHDLTMMQDDPRQSLRDFLLSKGGLQDQGGELSHRDIDVDLKPFEKKLIREGGLTLDEAAELAHEAGLIPERDLNALLQAIDAEHRGGTPTADWYREATTGKNKLTRERVDEAVAKIIADKGRDVGKDVERIKTILLQDQDFTASPHVPTTEEGWTSLVHAATHTPSQPDLLELGPNAAPLSPEGLASTPSPGTAPIDGVTQEERDQALFDEAQALMRRLPGNIGKAKQEGRLSPKQLGYLDRLDEIGRLLPGTSERWSRLAENARTSSNEKYQQDIAKYKSEQLARLKSTGFSLGDSVEFFASSMLGPFGGGQMYRGVIVQTPKGSIRVRDKGGRTYAFFENAWRASREQPEASPPPSAKPGQQEIAVPPPTIGERPIIGREPTKEEAPLLSLSAQEPDAEQGGLSFDLRTDSGAHEAATSPSNALTEPTEGQREAGNYRKGHVTIAGLDISIENPEGSTRSGVDANGKPWSVTMASHYGYIKGTIGKDKDHLDVFIKPGTPEDYSGPVYVIDQIKPGTKTFDEHKIVLGASSSSEARSIYQANYAKDWKGLASLSTFTMEQFKSWLEKGDHTKPAVNFKPSLQLEKDKLEAMRPSSQSDSAKALLSGRDGKLPDRKAAASKKLADYVESQLKTQKTAPGVLAFSLADLTKRADYEFGGTQAEGTYTPKDAFDAVELGVNQYIANDLYEHLSDDPMGTVTKSRLAVDTIRKTILDKIPGQQNRRTEEQDEFQQFSTPPDLAFVMAMAANISRGDTVLEPSAGLGGLAVFAQAQGATVYVNEYSARRADLLKALPFMRVFTENAEQLNNILPAEVKPTVILMNPPFSSTAGRMTGQRKSSNSIAHLEQALKRLAPGGRLVALIGKGKEAMGGETSKAVEDWIHAPGKTLRARIGVSGKGFKKYGTTYDNQILVFDKIETEGAPVLANVEDVREAIPLLKEVRDARVHLRAQPTADQSGSEAVADAGTDQSQPGQPLSISTDAVGTRPGRRPPVQGQSGQAGSPDAVRDRPTGQSGTQAGAGVRPAGERGAGFQPNRGATQFSTQPEGGSERSPGRPGPGTDRALGALPTEGVADSIRVEQADNTTPIAPGEESDGSVYEVYTPQKLKIAGAKGHPVELVESSAMAAVEPPAVTYQPKLPQSLIDSGKLSLAQLESIVYAGQSHEHILPSGARQGVFIGDGTGVGKGREISGVILDNKNQGRTKALWISKKSNLITDARRDWSGIGQDPTAIFDLSGRTVADAIPQRDGILFTSYNTLISGLKSDRGGLTPSKNKKTGEANASRLDQIVNWLGADFDGVIAFDEAHAMQNAAPSKGDRGEAKASSTGLVGLELQARLPNARVVYVSATGATEVANLAYAERLGLWGEGTAFPNRTSFIGKMIEGGLAAMEVVAQNIKAMGLYVARQLSYRGVTYERMEHKLTPKQRDVYDEMAKAWQIILNNINEALAATGGADDKGAKGAARGKLYGAQQRFFNQVLTSLQMPTVLESMQKHLDAGNAVVIQLVSTNEASQDREIDKVLALGEEGSLDDVDITPREILMSYLRNAFPTAQMEEYADESGKPAWRIVKDSNGTIVENAEAVAKRDALLDRFGSPSFGVPDGVMEMVIDKFGEKMVAEVTGRKERLIRVTNPDTGDIERVHQKGRTVKVREADAKSFMDDKKQALIFSDAGGTGMSYHADLASKNQRKRIHYLVQPGWVAANAVQGFGRTHRSNQKQPPHYILVQTDLKGHKRFVSSVARRLDQMGAITKGQRQTGTQGFFNEEDNLEGGYSNAAIKSFIKDVYAGHEPGFDWQGLIVERMGLDNLIDKRDGKFLEEKIPKTPKFLNRLLALEYHEQNAVFEAFQSRMQRLIRVAEATGQLDTGMETYKADSITLDGSEVVYTHPGTKAKAELQTFATEHKIAFVPFDEAKKFRHLIGFYQSQKTGKIVAALQPGTTTTLDNGDILPDILFRSPVYGRQTYSHTRALENGYTKLSTDDAEAAWKKAIQDTPTHKKETLHLLTGTLLPIWDRLPQGLVRIIRVTTNDGKRVIGRRIADEAVNPTKQKLGAETRSKTYTPDSAIEALNDKGATGKIRLANGWSVKRSKVNREWRYELKGDDLLEADSELQKAGVFRERIEYSTRWFIPVGRAGEVLGQLVRYRPILDVVGKTEETGSAASDDETEGTEQGVALHEPASPYPTQAPTFYSHVLKTLESKMPNRASFEQVKGILSPANGVKPDELKWLGLDDYLKTKDYFAKQEVLDFVRENQVQVQEVMKGAEQPSRWAAYGHDGIEWGEGETKELALANAKEFLWDEYAGESRTRLEEDAQDIADVTDDDVRGDLYDGLYASEVHKGESGTKFSDYQLPGGENYRELLLTLPERRSTGGKAEKIAQARYGKSFDELNEAQQLDITEDDPEPTVFKSSHFDESNILVHVRFNDRTGPNGEKVLFLEEVQSDFGQEMRRQKDAVEKAVDSDFLGIVERMEKAGVLTKECD